MRSSETLEREIDDLGDLPRSKLAEQWQSIYRVAPPKGARRVLLERAIAWHLQAVAVGGLSADTERALSRALSAERKRWSNNRAATVDAVSSDPSSGPKPSGSLSRARPSAGTRLIREWHGKTHVVDVLERGFVWEGKAYRSLSVIAKAITGAHWSGPRFFRL